MKNNRFYLKVFTIFFLVLLLLIPQAALMDLISERNNWRYQAYNSIQQSWPSAQTIVGAVVTIPYQTTHLTTEKIRDKEGEIKEITKKLTLQGRLIIIPKQLNITGNLESSIRYRGIYEVPVYSNKLQIKGAFSNEKLLTLITEMAKQDLQLGQAQFSVLVSDQRGITTLSSLNWDNKKLSFKPSSNLPNTSSGMHAKLPALEQQALTTIPFQFELDLRGMSQMGFVPLAENTELTISANWAHPKFTGELLPEQRTITDTDFTALWRASSFSYDVSQAVNSCEKGNCESLLNRGIGFQLLQPVDIYQQSERSIKYAILFIILTFVALILLELLKSLRIHPIQYTLVGMALTIFYLLLISLSEHFDFLRAYTIATVASVGLLTLYFTAILRNKALGIILGISLAILYSLLYFILQAEDNALLMGSLLLFGVLAALMLATRHFDWYNLTASMNSSNPSHGNKTKTDSPKDLIE